MMSDFFESFLTPPPTLNPIFTFYNRIFVGLFKPPFPLKSDIIYVRFLRAKSEQKMNKPNKKVVTNTHELRIDGHHLIEKTQKYFYHWEGIGKLLVLVHSRSIDDKSYQVEQTKDHFYGSWSSIPPQVKTDMTEDEVMKFEEDWTKLWDPEKISRVETDMMSDEAKKFEEDWTILWDPNHDI